MEKLKKFEIHLTENLLNHKILEVYEKLIIRQANFKRKKPNKEYKHSKVLEIVWSEVLRRMDYSC